jgi:hypothetical protein
MEVLADASKLIQRSNPHQHINLPTTQLASDIETIARVFSIREYFTSRPLLSVHHHQWLSRTMPGTWPGNANI